VAVYTVNRRRAIILLVLSSILLLTLDLRGNPLIDRMRSAFSNVLTPFEKAGDVIATPIRNAWHGATDYQDLERENEELREQIAQQRGNDLAARAAYGDYQQLLALSGVTTRYPTVTARVVGGAPGNFEQTVEIDRGGSDGIQVGMAVIDFAGMVGKITKVYDDRSVVRLVTDSAYAIECKVAGVNPPPGATSAPSSDGTSTSTADTTPSGIDVSDLTSTTTTLPPTTTTTILPDPDSSDVTSTTGTTLVPPETSTTVAATTTTVAPLIVRETGACQGRGIGKLPAMQYVTENQAVGTIDIGDVITTTGGSTSLAPPDITVGEVINKVTRSGSSGPLLEIELAADLDHLNFVKVIRYKPQNEVPG